ncbi:hypothetical protein RKD26_004004 [Streptomyces calvus]
MVCSPLGSFRCESGSSISFARHTSTPPTADVSVLTALKSATMKLSGLMPVSSVTVRMVQLGVRPLWPRLVLKRTPDSPGITFSLPSSCCVGQSGMSTIRSRGMLSAVALERSLETCSRIVVSACPALPVSPYPSLPEPVRLSVPISRMLIASSFLKPPVLAPSSETDEMLSFRCSRYR